MEIDIDYRIDNVSTITNVVAHEIGHTFDLGHCDQCSDKSVMSAGNTVYQFTLLACKTNPDSDYCLKAILNHSQGLPGPNNKDMEVLAQANPELYQCQTQQASNPPPTCNNGSSPSSVQTFASTGEASEPAYSCNGSVCDSCNSSCSSFSQQRCSGSAPTPPPPTCNEYCGSACLDSYSCPCAEGIPYCSNHIYPQCYCSPIAIDAFGTGFRFSDLIGGVKFKVKSDSPAVQMSWPAANSGNGLLVLDRNGNGTIDDFSELFGDMTPQPFSGEPNGYLALAVFDETANGGNGNRIIDPGDSVYSRLRLWIDDNHNGVSEPSELRRLQELGILAISLRYFPSRYIDPNGNQFRYRSLILALGFPTSAVCYDVFIAVEAQKKGIQ